MKTSVVTVAPANFAVSIKEAKEELRIAIDDTTSDSQIKRLIATATQWIERRYGIALITQTRKQTQDNFYARRQYYYRDPVTLLYPPIQSITSFKYDDQSGVEQTLVLNTDYTQAGIMTPVVGAQDIVTARLTPVNFWPIHQFYVPETIRIVYVCGFGSDSTYIPAPIKESILRIVTHLFENPMDEAAEVRFISKFGMGIDQLMSSYETFNHAGLYD